VLKSLIIAASLLGATLAPALAKDVRLAHDQRFSPFSQVVNGRSEGMTVDILRAAAERSGLSIVFVPVPFEEMQVTLTDGRADGVFPLAINEERRRTFDFSAPLLITGGALFTRAPGAVPENLAALAKKTVVTPSSGPLAGFIKRTAPDVNLVATSNYDESFAKLLSGEADAAALNLQVGTQMATKLDFGHSGGVAEGVGPGVRQG
jgi:polar amino acid transport system substrate-binding protein